jgi:hypothetical protein
LLNSNIARLIHICFDQSGVNEENPNLFAMEDVPQLFAQAIQSSL